MSKVFIKRGTRSQLDAAAAASGLNIGEPYLITDEDRIAVGLSETTYQDYALTSESPSKTFLNNTGSVLEAGSVVYVTGASGQQLTVAKALANTESTSSKTIGVVYKDVANGAIGQLVSEGVIKNVNTNGLTEGAALWLSPTVAGGFTTTKPSAPNHAVLVGFVLNASTNAGRIFVKISNGWELEELHNISIASLSDNDVLTYEAASGLWKNKPSSGSSTDIQEFSSSGNWTKPANATTVLVELWGAGGGGGSGAVSATGNMSGGTGGGGGGYNYKIFDAADVGSTVSVSIGAGGAGASAITTDSTVGIAGTTGGNTTFGSLLAAYGGAGGYGGVTSYSGVYGGGGGGSLSAGLTYIGGAPSTNTTVTQYNVFGGGYGANSTVSQPSIYGGGAGGGVNYNTYNHYYGAISVYSGGGGGAGQSYFNSTLTVPSGSNGTSAFGLNAIGGTAYVISNVNSAYPAVISSTVYWVSFKGIITSTINGTTYSNIDIGITGCYGRITYDGTYFYVTSDNGVYRSTDLVAWSQVTMPVTTQWRNSLYNSGTYIFVSTTGISVTTDFVNWNTYSVTGTNNNWSDIQFDGTTYIVIDSYTSGGNIAKSTDAATWTETASPTGGSVVSLAVNGSTWCVTSGSSVYRSTDGGSTWTSVKSSTRSFLYVSYVNSQFVLKGSGSSSQLWITYSSDDGITWTTESQVEVAPYGQVTKIVLLGSTLFYGSMASIAKSSTTYTSFATVPIYYTGTNGTNGGNGFIASGGGGGGTAANGLDSGAGGSGGNGFARITSW